MTPERWGTASCSSGHVTGLSFVDKDKKPIRHSAAPSESQPANSAEMEELFRRLSPALSPPRTGTDAIAAALEAAQRLAAETDAEDAASDLAQDLSGHERASGPTAGLCPVCGYRNRDGNRFCSMCGAAVEPETAALSPEPRRPSRAAALRPNPFQDHEHDPEPDRDARLTNPNRAPETHHYH